MLAAIQLLLSRTAVAIVIVPSQPAPHLSPRQLEGLRKLEGSKAFSSQMKKKREEGCISRKNARWTW